MQRSKDLPPFLSSFRFFRRLSVISVWIISHCCTLDHLGGFTEDVWGEINLLRINSYERKQKEAVQVEKKSELWCSPT